MKKIFFIILLLIVGMASASRIRKPESAQPEYQHVMRANGCMYGFIENKGQIIDQNNQLNPSVLYLYNGNSLHVQLKQSGFSYEVIKTESKPKAKTVNEINIHSKLAQDSLEYTFLVHRIDISFVAANLNAKIISSDAASDFINYYTTGTSEEGVTNVHHYKKVLYQNIYKNIDVEFVLNNNNQNGAFKYNFIVHPGGNPVDIQLKFDGSISTSLTSDGHITIETAYGNIDEGIPMSYQLDENNKQQKITSNFKPAYQSDSSLTAGRFETLNCYRIAVGNYNVTKTLIIDPVPWATYFGGSVYDAIRGIINDTIGNIFVQGTTNSTNNIATTGTYQTTLGGGFDLFAAKFNSSGMLFWSTYFGGTSDENGSGIVLDKKNNIFISGSSKSTTGIATSGVYKSSLSGIEDAFIAKFNSSGMRIWGTYYGGSSTDRGYDLITDTNGNVIVVGWTLSSSGIATSGAYKTNLSSTDDGFIAKFDSNGTSLIWGTYFGGNQDDDVSGITIDLKGNIIITGSTSSSWPNWLASTGAYQKVYGGGINDAYVAKFNANGVAISWATYFGGNNDDEGINVATDAGGNVYLSGLTGSTTGIATSGAYQSVLGGGSSDAFIVKFDSSGGFKFSTYFGGNGDEYANAMAVDSSGNISITGNTNSISGIASYSAIQMYYTGGTWGDAFIAKFDSIGIRKWSTYFGGNGDDFGAAIVFAGDGNILIGGATSSKLIIPATGSYRDTLYGATDAFLVSLSDNGMLYPVLQNNSISTSQAVCPKVFLSTLTGSTPTGGNGIYSYKWQKSTTSSSQGFVNAVGNDSSINYGPPPQSVNTWYRRIVYSGGYHDTSSVTALTLKLTSGFTINKTNQCLSDNNFIFNDSSTFISGTETRLWNFGTGVYDTSSLMNPVKVYLAIGNYTVRMRSVSSNGCWDSIAKTISVGNKPVAGFRIYSPLHQCRKGNYFNVTDTSKVSAGTLTRKWNFGEGPFDTAISSSPYKIYSTSGNFDIKLIATSYGCSDSASKTVLVNPTPAVGFTVNKSSQCINGNSFLFNDTTTINSGTFTRKWNFGTGVPDTSLIQNPAKVYSIVNSYSVKLITRSDSSCKDSTTMTVTLYPKPNVGFMINMTTQCLNGNNFLFNDTSRISIGGLLRLWSFGNGDTSNILNPNKIYTSANSYSVKLVSKSYNGCVDSLSKTVNVIQPKAGFNQNNLTQCLIGNNFFFDDTTSGSVTRLWNLGDLTTNTKVNFNKSYSNTGLYSVKLKITDSHNCTDSVTKQIAVKPNPAQPTITALTKSLLQSSVGDSYQWYLGNNPITGATSQTLSLTTNGDYNVKIDSVNGCSNMSNPFSAKAVGVNEIYFYDEIKIYPNPFTTELNLILQSSKESITKISIFDISGKLILESNSTLQKGISYSIPGTSNLNSGFYFMKLETQNASRVVKIVKE